MKAIIVNVEDLTIEEKQRVNEALAKIKNVNKCNPTQWDKLVVMYGPPSDCASVVFRLDRVDPYPTHTPQEVLEMAGMATKSKVRDMKAKRIAEIKANLKEQFSMLAEALKVEHGETSAASVIERARIMGNIAMLNVELSAVINAPDKQKEQGQSALQAECEKLRKDAERYRWLRDGNAYLPEENYIRGGQELDDLIDSEMEH